MLFPHGKKICSKKSRKLGSFVSLLCLWVLHLVTASFNLEAGHAAMVSVMKEEVTLVTLVKPQTEARRSQVRVLHQPVLTFGSYFGFILLAFRVYGFRV